MLAIGYVFGVFAIDKKQTGTLVLILEFFCVFFVWLFDFKCKKILGGTYLHLKDIIIRI